MKRLLLLSLAFCLGCSTTPMLTSKVKAKDVNEVFCFEPLSVINLIESKNHSAYNDSISQTSRQLQRKIIDDYRQPLHITRIFNWQDSSLNKRMRKEIQSLLTQCAKYDSPDSVKLTPMIDSLLENSNRRFGLIAVANGFTRTKENFSKQMTAALATGIATMGMYTRVPLRGTTTVYVILTDAKENNVAFYRVCELKDKDPLDEAIVRSAYKKIFKGYLPLE